MVSAAHHHQTKAALRSQVPFEIDIYRFPADTDSIGSLICSRAEQLEAAAVVMAKHTRGRISEAFIGSVTNYVLKHCHSPLFTVHSK